MSPPKLFISHSTKNAVNRAILEKICTTLDCNNPAGSFKLLVDKGIPYNTEWFNRLYDYMLECHAAVILMSREALENSEWVKAEAAILAARKRWSTSFALVVVTLDDVTPEHIQSHVFFDAIRLTDYQTIPNDGADTIIAKIRDTLQVLAVSDTPFDQMVIHMREILASIKAATPDALERAMAAINPDFKHHSEDRADSLVRLMLRNPQNIFGNAEKLFQQLWHLLDKRQAYRIIDIIKGHWVHPGAAVLLAKAHETQRVVTLNGKEVHEFTGDCYARKAWPAPANYKLVPVSGQARTLAQIEEALLNEVPKQSIPERLKRTALNTYTDPILLVFPYPDSLGPHALNAPFPDQGLLEDIRQGLRNVTVILATGDNIPPELNYVTPLEPLLEQDQEDNQLLAYSRVYKYIEENL